MVSPGVDCNGSQYVISLTKNSQLNGRLVVFGRIVEGMDVLEKLEKVRSRRLEDS